MKAILVALVLGGLGWLGWAIYDRVTAEKKDSRPRGAGAAPVEVAEIETGRIVERRVFSGELQATAQFVVAPKVDGRIEQLSVDLSDSVKRGSVVARLDDRELAQALAQARADKKVAEANFDEAVSALEIANRELARLQELHTRGVASESRLDVARSDQLAKDARVKVARAQVERAEAMVQAAAIRLGYTQISADWSGGDDSRVVAERFIDEGETVSANTPLMRIVELDPITGVIFVSERDYQHLVPNQKVKLTTDAYGDELFDGEIIRIAPVFQAGSRQARVELTVPNADRRLKPHMFIRAQVDLRADDAATVVPARALTSRGDEPGVFVVAPDGQSVHWRPVTVGIRQGERVQVAGDGLAGRVVTLGQHMLDDGSAVTIPARPAEAGGAGAATREAP